MKSADRWLTSVVPAKAGIQRRQAPEMQALDPFFRIRKQIRVEATTRKCSPRLSGESRDPLCSYPEVFKQWQYMADSSRARVAERWTPAFAAATGRCAVAEFFHTLFCR